MYYAHDKSGKEYAIGYAGGHYTIATYHNDSRGKKERIRLDSISTMLKVDSSVLSKMIKK